MSCDRNICYKQDYNGGCETCPRNEQEESMKKLFISCPMKGRTEENIRKSMDKMHKIAEIVFDQELEVIPTYIEHDPPENADKAIWYLGRSIQLMAEADYFIGVGYVEVFKGCVVEDRVARMYGIKATEVSLFEMMPDAVKVVEAYYDNKLIDAAVPNRL